MAVIPAPRPAVEHATGPLLVSDAALAAAAATNAAAFAAIYRRYGDDLYGFCVGILRDPDAAADCVHDVFVIAATRLGQLREQDKLRSWLYSIARHEALRRLKRGRREEPADQLPDTPDLAEGVEHDLARRELVELVAAACAGLSDQDRAIYQLHYHQGLGGPELAEALGVSASNANTRVGRMRDTVERSLGALLVARHQQDRCPRLAAVLSESGWDGALTALLRKRIARHIDDCPSCQRARSALVDPRALLASAPAVIPAPDWLRDKVLADTAPLVDAAAAAPAGAAAGATWWPAGIGVSTKTLIAAGAPVVAATVAVPLVLLGLAHTTSPSATPAIIAAPAATAPAPALSSTSHRGFTFDTSTTRYAPTSEPSTGAAPSTTHAPQSVPTTLGGSARPAPGPGGAAPTRSGQRSNGIGTPIIPPKNQPTDPPSVSATTAPPETRLTPTPTTAPGN